MDLPFFLWPLRTLLAAHLRRYDARVYSEDAAAARRREQYLGKNNWAWAFRPSQFLLHKDAVMEAFRTEIAACLPEPRFANEELLIDPV
jgi:hypothetical protein